MAGAQHGTAGVQHGTAWCVWISLKALTSRHWLKFWQWSLALRILNCVHCVMYYKWRNSGTGSLPVFKAVSRTPHNTNTSRSKANSTKHRSLERSSDHPVQIWCCFAEHASSLSASFRQSSTLIHHRRNKITATKTYTCSPPNMNVHICTPL